MDPLDEVVLTRRDLLALGGAAAASLALAACGSGSTKTSSGATTIPAAGLSNGRTATVKTCVYAKNHASSMLYWQQFAPPGVTVDVKPVTSTAEILQALEGGSLDFGLMSPYVPMLAQAKGGVTCKTVAMVARQGLGIVGRAGEVTTVAALRGKKIAVPPPGSPVLILKDVLAKAGLSLGTDVEAVPLGYADHVTALTRGDVQAFIGSEPPCTQAVVSGEGVRLPGVYDTLLGDLNTALWASAAMIEDEELCRVTVKMQRDAAEYMTPEGVNDKAVWHNLLVDQFGYQEDVYAAVLDNVGAVWKFDTSRENQYVGVGKALVANGELTAEPDYEALYARQYWAI